jgi:BirA family biotin operon repressor/biotin-[acetyl-CoA-carboxylase] ligase
MELQPILEYLADGEFHSGASLGRALGVSRTAVWKTLGQLESLGLSIESAKGRGYRLSRPLDLLSKERVNSNIDVGKHDLLSLELLLQVDSTNTYLLSKSPTGARYDCCLAEIQTAGKGRRGREWVSPFARNIYLSMAFDLDGGAEALEGLSLVVGLSIAKTIEAMGVEGVQLKWPNDVWLNGRKLSGVLVELSGEATTGWRVVLGLGLNVDMSSSEAEGIDQPWASLSEVLSVSRNGLAADLISGLIDDLERYKTNGFSGFLGRWRKYDGLAGRQIEINAGALSGVARGVDVTGALLLDVGREVLTVNAGEVTVRSVTC